MATNHTTPRVAVSPGETAEMLGVTRRTVYAMASRGELTIHHAGRRALIAVGDVLALVGREGESLPVPTATELARTSREEQGLPAEVDEVTAQRIAALLRGGDAA